MVFAVGLFVGQAAVLWFTPILTLNYPTLYITRESLIAVSLKYCAAIVLEIAVSYSFSFLVDSRIPNPF